MMSIKKPEVEIKMADKQVKDRRRKVLESRRLQSKGPIERCAPAPREGYHQHVCTAHEARTNQMINELGYDHRKDENGNNVTFKARNGEEFCVMELPLELWVDAQEYKNKEANKFMEQIQRKKISGGSNEYFSDGAELSDGTS